MFLPANEIALVHGGRRLSFRGTGSALDEARRVEIREAVIADLGGAPEVAETLRHLVEDFAAAVLVRDACWQHIQAVGPFTKAGARRSAVDLYLQASARAERLASTIGTTRRPRPVKTLHEVLAQRAGEAEAGRIVEAEPPVSPSPGFSQPLGPAAAPGEVEK